MQTYLTPLVGLSARFPVGFTMEKKKIIRSIQSRRQGKTYKVIRVVHDFCYSFNIVERDIVYQPVTVFQDNELLCWVDPRFPSATMMGWTQLIDQTLSIQTILLFQA